MGELSVAAGAEPLAALAHFRLPIPPKRLETSFR